MGMAGFMTMECCRLEKGYLHWGHEIGPEENPHQAGLGFALKAGKPEGFLGLEALKNRKSDNDAKLVLLECRAGRPLLLHDEPIYLDGRHVGRTTSGGVGFRTGKVLCFAYLEAESVAGNNGDLEFQVKVAGEMFDLHILDRAPYDPRGERMRS